MKKKERKREKGKARTRKEKRKGKIQMKKEKAEEQKRKRTATNGSHSLVRCIMQRGKYKKLFCHVMSTVLKLERKTEKQQLRFMTDSPVSHSCF